MSTVILDRDPTAAALSRRMPFGRGAVWANSRERERLRRLMLFALAWALMGTMIEVPYIASSYGVAELTRIIVRILSNFAELGLFMAVAVWWATIGGPRWPRLFVAVAAASLVGGLFIGVVVAPIWNAFADDGYALDGSVLDRSTLASLFAYHTWLAFVYGGFGAIIYGLRLRIDQTTQVLRSAVLARERSEASIAEARTQAMVERVEPAFVLDVMNTAQRLYPVDPARAEAIIDGCVGFLRSAMPQIRSGHSSLAAELAMAEAYFTLRRLTRDDAPRSRIGLYDAALASHIALPPFVVLPLLEPLTATAGSAATIVVDVALSTDAVVVDVRAPATTPLDAVPLQAIAARLRLACGASAAACRIDAGDDTAVYRLSCPRIATAFQPPSTANEELSP